MKTIVSIIILAISVAGFAQQPCGKGRLSPTAQVSPTPQEEFENDLKDNNIKIYVMGGIAAVITLEDRDIAKKYGFDFHDFGCLAPDLNYYKAYNKCVVSYLNKKHGKGWQKDIRKNLNIIGRDSLLMEK